MANVGGSKWSAWRLAWCLLAGLATAELAATLWFWTSVVQPAASAPPFDRATLPVLAGVASLWSYVVFAFILYGLQRAVSGSRA
jgi:hypothetical protein